MSLNKPARGGKTVFGAAVGILMLDTQFPRIPGDMGNAQTWPFPVLYKIVRGASPDMVVRHGATGLEETFIKAAQELVADGADGITTNCGFLALFQDLISSAVGVPVATSSLMQIPLVQQTLPPGKHVSVLTISASTLSPDHMKAVGAPADTPIVGTDKGKEFSRAILNDEIELDVELSRVDLLEAGADLMRQYPETGAIVLECTNMVPYAADLRQAFNVPVFSIYSFISWFQSGLMPPVYDPRLVDPRRI